jgi:ribose-phosphate pyrophosphokinase
LARDIAKLAGLPVGKMQIETFPDGEIGVQVLENVRDRDVFLVQSPAGHPNRYLVELLLMVDAMKRSTVNTINVIMPSFPYARQDRREENQTAIAAKLVADLLEKAGVNRLITMDLHSGQVEGFFGIPVHHLHARPLFIKALKKVKNAVIVAPDIGAVAMAKRFAEELGLDFAIVRKRRISGSKVEAEALVGDVKGKDVILVDDLISTGGTLKAAAKICKKEGAKNCIAVATHSHVDGKIEGIDQLIVTDTIPQKNKGAEVVSTAALFAKCIEEV